MPWPHAEVGRHECDGFFGANNGKHIALVQPGHRVSTLQPLHDGTSKLRGSHSLGIARLRRRVGERLLDTRGHLVDRGANRKVDDAVGVLFGGGFGLSESIPGKVWKVGAKRRACRGCH